MTHIHIIGVNEIDPRAEVKRAVRDMLTLLPTDRLPGAHDRVRHYNQLYLGKLRETYLLHYHDLADFYRWLCSSAEQYERALTDVSFTIPFIRSRLGLFQHLGIVDPKAGCYLAAVLTAAEFDHRIATGNTQHLLSTKEAIAALEAELAARRTNPSITS